MTNERDWYDRAGGIASTGVEMPRENGSGETKTEAVTPDDWPVLDEAALHGLAGDIVRTIGPETEADPVAVLIHLLVMFGNAIGRAAYVQVGPDRHFGNLFAVIVGESSMGRKGMAVSEARRLFRLAEPLWEGSRILSGLSTGEGLIYAVRDPVKKEEKVKDKDGTEHFETVTVDPGVQDKRLLAMSSEFASTLKVAAREGNILSDTVKLAWETGDLGVMVKNSPNKATGAHISIAGSSTVLDIQKYLSDTEAGNGFGNRFLWVCARRSQLLPEAGNLTDEDLAPLARRIETAAYGARLVSRVSRDTEAGALWHRAYNERLGLGGVGLYGALTNRAAPQALRLSLLYALLDGSKEIRLEHLEAALALWNYCDKSVRYIFGGAIGDKTADRIIAALAQRPDGMARNDINEMFGGHVKAQELDRAVALLERLGKITTRLVSTGGRKETRHFVK